MNTQELAQHLISVTPDFEIVDEFEEDDINLATKEITATWVNFGYPVTATAIVENYEGVWGIDVEDGITVTVDDTENPDYANVDVVLEQQYMNELLDIFIDYVR